ncbi:hypothetical protein JOD43_001537 [Pullulanibacillus pueri]|nr:hypothetical protein [Pullulanibacillus pueri]
MTYNRLHEEYWTSNEDLSNYELMVFTAWVAVFFTINLLKWG